MNAAYLTKLLTDAERAHAASGHGAAGWAEWYAQYMLPILVDKMEQESEVQAKRAWG